MTSMLHLQLLEPKEWVLFRKAVCCNHRVYPKLSLPKQGRWVTGSTPAYLIGLPGPHLTA